MKTMQQCKRYEEAWEMGTGAAPLNGENQIQGNTVNRLLMFIMIIPIFTSVMVRGDDAERRLKNLQAINRDDVAYVIVAWSDKRRIETNFAGTGIVELFRIEKRMEVGDLVRALKLTGREESKGGTFSGYLPTQYFIGTNGDVIVEGTVMLDRNVSCGKSSSLINGKISEKCSEPWDGPYAPNGTYVRLVYDHLERHAPDVVSWFDKQLKNQGGVGAALHIEAPKSSNPGATLDPSKDGKR